MGLGLAVLSSVITVSLRSDADFASIIAGKTYLILQEPCVPYHSTVLLCIQIEFASVQLENGCEGCWFVGDIGCFWYRTQHSTGEVRCCYQYDDLHQ